MSRKRAAADLQPDPAGKAPAPAAPSVIAPTGIYSVDQAQHALGLPRTCLRREVREGRLKVSKRAGRYFLLGKWLIEWVESGVVRRGRPSPDPCACLPDAPPG